MATGAWRDSRGPGGGVERVRSWVAGSVSGQGGDVEGGPPWASQRRAMPGRKNAVPARKDSRWQRRCLREASCDGGMVPQITNSSIGGVRLGRMVGTAAMKTTGSRRVSPRKAP